MKYGFLAISTWAILGGMRTFGQNLKELRTAKGLSQWQLAERLEVRQSQVSNWENDKRGMPGMNTVLRVASALECQIEDLVRGINEEYEHYLERQHTDDLEWAEWKRQLGAVIEAMRAGYLSPDDYDDIDFRAAIHAAQVIEQLKHLPATVDGNAARRAIVKADEALHNQNHELAGLLQLAQERERAGERFIDPASLPETTFDDDLNRYFWPTRHGAAIVDVIDDGTAPPEGPNDPSVIGSIIAPGDFTREGGFGVRLRTNSMADLYPVGTVFVVQRDPDERYMFSGSVYYVSLKSGEHTIAILREVEGGYLLEWLNSRECPTRFVPADDLIAIRDVLWVRTISKADSLSPPTSRDTGRDDVMPLDVDDFANVIRIASDARRQPMPKVYLDQNGLPDLSAPTPAHVTDTPFNRALLAIKAHLRNRHKAAAFVQRWNALMAIAKDGRIDRWEKPYTPTSHTGPEYTPTKRDELIFKGVLEAAATLPLRAESTFDADVFFETVEAIERSGKYAEDDWDKPRWALVSPIFERDSIELAAAENDHEDDDTPQELTDGSV